MLEEHQDGQMINNYIEEYLDYYCGLKHSPGFAVLLKGKWGSGKTWFIKRYREKLERKGSKCLYISLYGIMNFSEVEYAFFQQLHPLLSSKGMAIAGKVFKGFLKGAFKIDLNADGRDDGTVNFQLPEINLPEYLKDADKHILIFDDLERCKIDAVSILGYINYFVEHQDLKVVIVANEEEVLKGEDYQAIKEKLIGKTFNISLAFEAALENFITTVDHVEARIFLSENIELIRGFYEKAEYENLRSLKQIVLDFERIFLVLENKFHSLLEEVTSTSEILQEILKFLMAFSIEINCGAMLPTDISQLEEEHTAKWLRTSNERRLHGTNESNKVELTALQNILSKYAFLDLHNPFPSRIWWQTFFDKGIIDIKELEQSLLNSKYYKSKNVPAWVKLWNFSDFPDDEFDIVINEVETEYNSRNYREIGIIKHVFGLFLEFSNADLYPKDKKKVLEEGKLYIDYMRDNEPSALIFSSVGEDAFGGYRGLGFQGRDFDEFQELNSYIIEARESARERNMPLAAQELIDFVKTDSWKFYRRICLSNNQDEVASILRYYETPVLNHIEPSIFVESFLSVEYEDQRCIFWALQNRYKFNDFNKKLIQELEWLKSIKHLLCQEVVRRQGKVSGLVLDRLIKYNLDDTLRNFESSLAET